MSEAERPAPSDPKTVGEIAAATGYSPTTVRLVVGGQSERYRIKSETRERIERYVAEHGLRINHAARSLKLRRSEAIGLVVPDLANAFFARLTAELEERCRAHGLVLLTASSREEQEREIRAIEGLTARGVDGLVVASCRASATFASARRRGRTAMVLVDRALADAPVPTVVGDNEGSARRLTERLLEHGPVDFLAGCPRLPSIADRIRGFGTTLAAAGIGDAEQRIHRSDTDDVAAGATLMTRLITTRGAVPGVFMCSSLLMLDGALQAIVAACGRLPPEVVIGTFDHHPLLDFVANRILSIRQDEPAIAERAFRCLLAQIDGAPAQPERHVVPGRLTDHPA